MRLAATAPLALVACVVLGGVLWETVRPSRTARTRKGLRSEAMDRRRGSQRSVLKQGLWTAAPAALFFLDLLWPSVTRTLPVMILQRTFLD